jgi:hypothetical protein
MTSCSETPSSFACFGICSSTNGVRTKPGQITLAADAVRGAFLGNDLCQAYQAVLGGYIRPLSTEASFECTEPM